jgi:hypothetical protein
MADPVLTGEMLMKTHEIFLFAAALAASASIACSDGSNPDDPGYPVPFSTSDKYLTVWDGKAYNPLFLKGMNLGAAVPGTSAGELAISRDQYERWLKRMHEIGINALRIYTLHYPVFYEVLEAFNTAHKDKPIYLLQGIWLDEDNYGLDLHEMTARFDEAIHRRGRGLHARQQVHRPQVRQGVRRVQDRRVPVDHRLDHRQGDIPG